MKTLRAGWRLLLIAKATAFFYLLWLSQKALFFRSAGSRIRGRNYCFRNWSRSVLWILNAQISTFGTAPKAPFFLVANHLSYVDVVVLASHLDAVFVARSDVGAWPVIGRLCRSIGTIFVDRTIRRDVGRVVAEIDKALASGQGVVLFPEGTSTAGFEVGPFRPSLLEAVARRRTPVSYAALSYQTGSKLQPAHLAVCWWGEMEFPTHFWQLLTLGGFSATLSFGQERIQESDRKRLAQRLWKAVDLLRSSSGDPSSARA